MNKKDKIYKKKFKKDKNYKKSNYKELIKLVNQIIIDHFKKEKRLKIGIELMTLMIFLMKKNCTKNSSNKK